MIHKAWVLDIKIRKCWVSGRLFIGGNPFEHNLAANFAEQNGISIDNVRIRRIKHKNEFMSLAIELSDENLLKIGIKNSKEFIKGYCTIEVGDEVYFDDGVYTVDACNLGK